MKEVASPSLLESVFRASSALFVFLPVCACEGQPGDHRECAGFLAEGGCRLDKLLCAADCGCRPGVRFAANGHISLIQGFNLAPQAPGDQPATDDGASTIIGGNPYQGPPCALNPVNLANQMGTDANHGTTVNGMLNGLEGYLESEDGVDGFRELEHVPAPVQRRRAAPFWSTLQGELPLGKGILLAIGWKNGAPGGKN